MRGVTLISAWSASGERGPPVHAGNMLRELPHATWRRVAPFVLYVAALSMAVSIIVCTARYVGAGIFELISDTQIGRAALATGKVSGNESTAHKREARIAETAREEAVARSSTTHQPEPAARTEQTAAETAPMIRALPATPPSVTQQHRTQPAEAATGNAIPPSNPVRSALDRIIAAIRQPSAISALVVAAAAERLPLGRREPARPGARQSALRADDLFSDLEQDEDRTATRSVIDAWLRITGNLESEGEILVDGQIRGDIRCARLIAGENATIIGNIAADEVIVRGKINGLICAHDVILHADAHIEGEIFHAVLTIEQGAYFEGDARVRKDPMTAQGPQASSAQLQDVKRSARRVGSAA
jgi:cytoskeletal protein CcmA (bactofilin family)